MRTGYTTGACAAAAARAAAEALLVQENITSAEITLGNGQPAWFCIHKCSFDKDRAACSVIKDAGDDPDITDGAEIVASVELTRLPGISVTGGLGVGRVTKPGLDVAIGESAINPVPRRMITEAVAEAAAIHGCRDGIKVTISVPRGGQLATMTLNGRLGITGGISIIGTTGIVIPYSRKAYAACISRSLDVAKACGCRRVVFTTGRRSEKYAQQALGLPEESYILTGDFVGHAVKQAAKKGIPSATVWGMIGKVSKLAAGHLYTNVSDSRVSIDLLMNIAGESGIPVGVLERLRNSVTANQVRKLLPGEYAGTFCSKLAAMAAAKCREAVSGRIEVTCIITDPAGAVLGRSDA